MNNFVQKKLSKHGFEIIASQYTILKSYIFNLRAKKKVSCEGVPWRCRRPGASPPPSNEYHSKASHASFLVHIKVTFTLYCSLLSVQSHYVLRKYIP